MEEEDEEEEEEEKKRRGHKRREGRNIIPSIIYFPFSDLFSFLGKKEK